MCNPKGIFPAMNGAEGDELLILISFKLGAYRKKDDIRISQFTKIAVVPLRRLSKITKIRDVLWPSWGTLSLN